MKTSPIWKNTYYTTAATQVNYNIMLSGENIMSGKANRYPGSDSIEINLDRVCCNYLDSDISPLLETLPTQTTSMDHPEAQRTFELWINDSKVEDYRFYNDWSYNTDKPMTGSTINISNPINGRYVPGMMKLRTIRKTTSSLSRVYTEGNSGNGPGLGYDKLARCANYAIYYRNIYGGWDSYLVEGGGKKTDNYTTFQTDMIFRNDSLDFETNKYVQEIKTTYDLTTGMMTDVESENFARNLLGSTKVYLHDLVEDKVIPVVIDDKSVTYQTYTSNGMKLSQYKFKLTESQHKTRI